MEDKPIFSWPISRAEFFEKIILKLSQEKVFRRCVSLIILFAGFTTFVLIGGMIDYRILPTPEAWGMLWLGAILVLILDGWLER